MSEKKIPFIYNLFPPLVGESDKWFSHVQRAADMGFNWVFLNPIHLTGASGSLYAIRDYFKFSPVFFPLDDFGAQKAEFTRFIEQCQEIGVEVMVDLVINHTAYDNPLTRDHRDWFKTNDDGSIMNPGAADDSAPGGYVTWGDLNEIDNAHSNDKKNLHEYWWKLVEMFIDCGVRGFRCDAAYQIPNDLWAMLIKRSQEKEPETMFFAESLGCPIEQTIGLSSAGHDYTFNSGKWWDYKGDWFIDQMNQMAGKTSSICFPESHDTDRLAEEWGGDADRVKQHYMMSALISSGVLITMGFEYGFRKRTHVVTSNPLDYEGANFDLTDFIRQINNVKKSCRALQEDNRVEKIECGNGNILVLRKTTLDGQDSALLIFNTTDSEQDLSLNKINGKNGITIAEAERTKTLKLQRYGVAVISL